jgi:hypothetical protein
MQGGRNFFPLNVSWAFMFRIKYCLHNGKNRSELGFLNIEKNVINAEAWEQ